MSATVIEIPAGKQIIQGVLLQDGHCSAVVAPSCGFSLLSFKSQGREYLDAWDLDAFAGSQADVEHVSRDVTDTFRKGFGPSIGPWFGGRAEGDKTWNHGVCRFADWSKSCKTEGASITGRLDGSKVMLLGQTLDSICGYHLDVEITFTLQNNTLIYRVRNFSEGKKGTYGIHWYWKNPSGSKLFIHPDMAKLPALDTTRFTVADNRVSADSAAPLGQRFDNGPMGDSMLRGGLIYPDGATLEFRHSDSFIYTMLFATQQAFCYEPVSGPAWQVGTFEEGEITICAALRHGHPSQQSS